MGFKLQYFCAAALFLCLMKAGKVRAQCTLPSFESKNVIPSDSQSSTASFPDGSTLTYECVIGFQPINSRASKSVTCEKKQWTDLQLECTKKSCGSPPEFDNGHYEKEGILFGDKITAVCDKGFILAGQMKDRWCRSEGWDGREPECERPCSRPDFRGNFTLTKEFHPQESFPHGLTVTFECVPGHEPVDSSVSRSITCEETKWTERRFTCKVVKCEALPAIENGSA